MLSANDVDLPGPLGRSLARLFDNLVHGQRVGTRFVHIARESTEPAVVPAHVGVVDVPVHHEVGVVAHRRPPRPIREPADAQEVVGLKKGYAVAKIQALAASYLFFDES